VLMARFDVNSNNKRRSLLLLSVKTVNGFARTASRLTVQRVLLFDLTCAWHVTMFCDNDVDESTSTACLTVVF